MPQASLCGAVWTQLDRLGAIVRRRSAPKVVRLPEPIRQLEEDVALPDPIDATDGEPRPVQWEPGSNVIEGYSVLEHGPWYVLATDEHCSMWILRLDDSNLSDPLVHFLDHEDFELSNPESTPCRLSEWLAGFDPG